MMTAERKELLRREIEDLKEERDNLEQHLITLTVRIRELTEELG